MKKLLAIILISLMLLSSCTAPTDQSKEAPTDTTAAATTAPTSVPQSNEIEMKMTNGLVITSKYPEKRHAYQKSDVNPPSDIDYIVRLKSGIDESVLTYKMDLTYNTNLYNYKELEKSYHDVKTDFAGIIDNKEKFISCYESLTGEKYSKRFSDTFFDDNIIIISQAFGFEHVFVGFEYGFEANLKKLKVVFFTRPHEGWHECTTEELGACIYIVPIAKKDIMIDGKLIPYDELTIEYIGMNAEIFS
jgi:hypothetical protein